MQKLARVELDDELLLNWQSHGFARGQCAHDASERIAVELDPIGLLATTGGLQTLLNALQALARVAKRDLVARANQERGDVDALTVDLDVLVAHQLARVGTR